MIPKAPPHPELNLPESTPPSHGTPQQDQIHARRKRHEPLNWSYEENCQSRAFVNASPLICHSICVPQSFASHGSFATQIYEFPPSGWEPLEGTAAKLVQTAPHKMNALSNRSDTHLFPRQIMILFSSPINSRVKSQLTHDTKIGHGGCRS